MRLIVYLLKPTSILALTAVFCTVCVLAQGYVIQQMSRLKQDASILKIESKCNLKIVYMYPVIPSYVCTNIYIFKVLNFNIYYTDSDTGVGEGCIEAGVPKLRDSLTNSTQQDAKNSNFLTLEQKKA